ncbi:unnamed protein product [Owenia fusiformis]|uniref:Sushi domain-containing protein n=1 Tax=Owenia fusiformis TaxID=6347 RepID=A0A8S4PV55_OWEFU|nr:unnamed protein product [Owenia fusiformis]
MVLYMRDIIQIIFVIVSQYYYGSDGIVIDTFVGFNVPGGTQIFSATTSTECIQFCEDQSDCMAVDFDTGNQGCFSHGVDNVEFLCSSDALQTLSSSTHYRLVNCSLPVLEQYSDVNVFGGVIVPGVTTVRDCLNSCNASCSAVDFNFLSNLCYSHDTTTTCNSFNFVNNITHYKKQRCSGGVAQVDCGSLPAPANGTVTGGATTVGLGQYFSCNTGFTISGSTVRFCQLNGTYDGTAPTCTIVDCGSLDTPTNGTLNITGTVYNSVADFTCDTGFTLFGSPTRICLSLGVWSGRQPECFLNYCPSLPEIANGIKSGNGTAYNTVVNYTCDTGYTLVGSSSRLCLANSTWSGTNTTCIINDCGTLPAPSNGTVDSTTSTFNTTVTFSCDDGYSLSGSTSRTCQANSTWDGTETVCTIRDCGELNPPIGYASATGSSYFPNSVVTFTCQTGYTLFGSSSRTCQNDGTWSGTETNCTIIDCGVLATPGNGSVSGSSTTTYNSVIVFKCNTGYTLSGSSVRTCQVDSTWSGSDASCTIVDCGSLDTPANSTLVITGTVYNSVATFTCPTGYNLKGNSSRTCLSTGMWSNHQPECEIVDCGQLNPPIGYASVTGSSYTYNSVVTFTCQTDYTLLGNSSRTCQIDSTWSGTETNCTIIDCGALDTPGNGSVSGSDVTTYNSVIAFECNTGYTLSGSSVRTCQVDGTWSGSNTSCTVVDCGVPYTSNGLNVSYTTTLVGSNATYTCPTGTTLIDGNDITCLSSGLWSYTAARCCISKDYIYYMPMEEIQSPDTLVGSCITGKINNNASLVEGRIGKGLNLDGINQSVDLGNRRTECFGDLELCPNGYTLSLWLKIGKTSGRSLYYLSSGGQTYQSYGMTLLLQSSRILVTFTTKTKSWSVSYSSPTAAEWHQVVMTWKDPSISDMYTSDVAKLSLWWDGVNVATANSFASRNVQTTVFNDFVIGRPNNGFARYGEAVIDELIFWDKELDDARVMGLWESYKGNPNSTLTCS